MTLNFTRSELITAIHAMSPYIVSKSAVSLRVAEGGMLDLFATAFIEGGSALVRVPCNQTHKPVPWTHVDGTVLQQAIQMAEEGVVALEFEKDKLTLKYPGAVFELRTLTPPITPEKIKFGVSSQKIGAETLKVSCAGKISQ